MDDVTQKIDAISKDLEIVQEDMPKQIKTEQEKVAAIEFVGEIKKRYNRIEQLRKFFTQPLNDQIKKINGMFKIHSEKLKNMEEFVKKIILEFVNKQEEIRKKEAEKAKKRDMVVEQVPLQTRTSEGVMSVKKVWKFEIVNAEKVPKKYWMINESLIREDISAGVRDIQGIRVFQENQLSHRI